MLKHKLWSGETVQGVKWPHGPYIVGERGEVYSIRSHKYLTACPGGRPGHLQVWLVRSDQTAGWHKVHRLVASLYVPNGQNHPNVLFRQGKSLHYTNLVWGVRGQGARRKEQSAAPL